MNRYKLTFQSSDQRVWQVDVKADGISESKDLVKFWRYGWLWFRRPAHYIAKSMLISVIGDKENK